MKEDKNSEPVISDIPASKSHSIRALILASLADGESAIENILLSEDTESAIEIFCALGVKVELKKNADGAYTAKVKPPKQGLKNMIEEKKAKRNKEGFTLISEIDVENSGSLLYFLGCIFSFFAFDFILTGDKSIRSRPLKPLLEIYDKLGIKYEFLTVKAREERTAPIQVYGKKIKAIPPFVLDGKFSQPVSGLLMAASFASSDIEFSLEQAGELPYLKMTCEWLKKANIEFTADDDFKHFKIKHSQNFKSFKASIPADWSGATFPIVGAVITNSKLTIENIDINDIQGDSEVVSVLKKMGVDISFNDEEEFLKILPSFDKLKGIEYDCSNIPDSIPALSVLACFAKGKTKLKNIEICRFKECDRIAVMASELSKLGADVQEEIDALIINGHGGVDLDSTKDSAKVDSFNDHRIAMALMLFNLALQKLKNKSIEIQNADCYSVSYPNFIEHLKLIENSF